MQTTKILQNWLSVFFIILLAMVNVAFAEDINLRPGLWEVITESDLLIFAKQIPSEQMQQAEQLAKEYGIDMPKIENGAAISKVCVTPQMSQTKQLPIFYQAESGCKSTKSSRNGNQYAVNFECNSAQLKGRGSATGLLTSAERFSGHTKFTGTAQGTPLDEQADIYGKWLATDCGEIKPM